jgi:hypothetical protein
MFGTQIWIIVSGIVLGAGAGIVLVWAPWRAKVVLADDEGSKHTSFVFSGNLKQTNLLEAIQFLEIGRREGILHVYSGRRKGYLIFSNGQLIDAFYRNQSGRDGVLSMLGLEEGDFYFEPKAIHQPRLITDSIMDIAFEWDEIRQGSM